MPQRLCCTCLRPLQRRSDFFCRCFGQQASAKLHLEERLFRRLQRHVFLVNCVLRIAGPALVHHFLRDRFLGDGAHRLRLTVSVGASRLRPVMVALFETESSESQTQRMTASQRSTAQTYLWTGCLNVKPTFSLPMAVNQQHVQYRGEDGPAQHCREVRKNGLKLFRGLVSLFLHLQSGSGPKQAPPLGFGLTIAKFCRAPFPRCKTKLICTRARVHAARLR